MCGIVGLHLKNSQLEHRLGELLVPMVDALAVRGPDSAGYALYVADAPPGAFKYSLRAPHDGYDWKGAGRSLETRLNSSIEIRPKANDAVLVTTTDEAAFRAALAEEAPDVKIFGWGRTLEVYKDVGHPLEICDRYGLPTATGYQGLGHTRMATESAVTTEHSHPFGVAEDLAVVHNGSFSNHATIRRELIDRGHHFDTDNDTEVGARLIADTLSTGADLEVALKTIVARMDGFFTLLVATRTQFAVVRDAFACKPLVVAETDDYVAVGSEYCALADLPGIEGARVFEPMPEEVHTWTAEGA
jgi:methylamine---glutamate N-methyltransferase subunit A